MCVVIYILLESNFIKREGVGVGVLGGVGVVSAILVFWKVKAKKDKNRGRRKLDL